MEGKVRAGRLWLTDMIESLPTRSERCAEFGDVELDEIQGSEAERPWTASWRHMSHVSKKISGASSCACGVVCIQWTDRFDNYRDYYLVARLSIDHHD